MAEPTSVAVGLERVKTRRISLAGVPWWAVIIAILGVYVGYAILTSETYLKVLRFVLDGVKLTLQATLSAFALALALGLMGGLGRVSKNPVLYAIATLYVEVIRGLPMLVIILYVGFVIGPGIRDLTGGAFDPPMLQRAIAGLGFGYGAYLTEIYRAGIQSIHRGQMEAARSLGMSYAQAMRHVILPQAFKRIIPPLAGQFISLIKDSSLVSVIALADLMFQGQQAVARSYYAFEIYFTVAFLYLVLTFTLSMATQFIERRLRISD